jgi:hypothetical protein
MLAFQSMKRARDDDEDEDEERYIAVSDFLAARDSTRLTVATEISSMGIPRLSSCTHKLSVSSEPHNTGIAAPQCAKSRRRDTHSIRL